MAKHFLFLLMAYPLYASSFDLDNSLVQDIGEKIWKNECKKSYDLLLNWKEGENFLSLGIGHFIWYSKEKEKIYNEQFPLLVQYLEENKVAIPSWLKEDPFCPWKTKEEFLLAKDDPKYRDLKELLSSTIGLQASFIVKRMQRSLDKITLGLPSSEEVKIRQNFEKVAKEKNGLYALIDYINFKGEGADLNENYNGVRWGLLQVLQNMNTESNRPPLQEFIKSAKNVLENRVLNAPYGKEEKKWLQGWYNRLDTYLTNSQENP